MKEEAVTPIRQNSVIVPLLVGGIVGAALGILLAPKAGRDTRKQIKDLAVDTKEKLVTAIDRSKEFYDEARLAVSNAVDAGKHAVDTGKQAFIEERKKFQTAH
jgi:gas vesicle protein